jgi:trans-2,3-dihydro-3-hydroxyanthranilate isomerase
MDDDHLRLGSFNPFARAGSHERPYRYLLLDVFSDVPLAGNQLAVLPDGTGLSDRQMQAIAREFNLSETVFLLPTDDDADALARIFTPRAELPFAGHPILGSAAVVGWALERETVRLLTGVGQVPVDIGTDRAWRAFGRMQQPIPSWQRFPDSEALLSALGVEGSGLPVEVYENGPRHVFIELASENAVAAVRPDAGALAAFGEIGVSCFAGHGQRWKTRMFAPGMGISEDPATGSAAGPLALHLARHGRVPFGEEIQIRQGQEIDRPSLLLARVVGSPERIQQIEVGGSVVLVGAGTLQI